MSSPKHKTWLTVFGFGCLLLATTWGVLLHRAGRRQLAIVPHGALPPVRGFSMQINHPDQIAAYEHSMVTLQKLGCHWLNIVFQARMKHITSRKLYWNRSVLPSRAKMTQLLLYARKHGLHTMVMPIFLIDNAVGDEWRGAIKPPDWQAWFRSYRQYIKLCASAAQNGHAAIFSVGSELLTTEKFTPQWLRIVRDARRAFKGKLTYSANWDHFQYVGIWKQLDYIGMNAYYQLARHPGYSAEHIERVWQPVQRNILQFARRYNKPMLFTEIGWDNLQNTVMAPWDYIGTGPMDPDEQLRAYQAFAAVWRGLPANVFAGAFIWEWVPGGKPGEYGSYSLQGEPALRIVMHWISGKPVPDVHKP